MSLKLHREEIAKHNSIDDAWVIVDGAVYDVTSFLPGGLSITEEYTVSWHRCESRDPL